VQVRHPNGWQRRAVKGFPFKRAVGFFSTSSPNGGTADGLDRGCQGGCRPPLVRTAMAPDGFTYSVPASTVYPLVLACVRLMQRRVSKEVDHRHMLGNPMILVTVLNQIRRPDSGVKVYLREYSARAQLGQKPRRLVSGADPAPVWSPCCWTRARPISVQHPQKFWGSSALAHACAKTNHEPSSGHNFQAARQSWTQTQKLSCDFNHRHCPVLEQWPARLG